MEKKVRRTCLNCQHSWVMTKQDAKLKKGGLGLAFTAMSGTDGAVIAGALSNKIQGLTTCPSCGSRDHYRDAPL